MRIVLLDKKQKELIKKEKENLTLDQLAKRLKITPNQIRGHYYKKVLFQEEVFNRFSLKEEYASFIVEKKEENWGRSRGGKNSSGSMIKHIEFPIDSEDLAEFYGIMLGDGNMTKIKKYKVGTYQIRIVGDSRYDKEYLLNFVRPMIEKMFKMRVGQSNSKKKNAIYITATGLRLIEFLERKGFKAGDKIRNKLPIPDWIKKNPKFLKACLRGLYDTDGSVYKLTGQNSHQISFRNYNLQLIEDVRNSLLNLKIGCSRISKGNEITITKKSELRKFLNEIGFHNFKHRVKVSKYGLAP
ncbi:hypothetical protein KA107_01590 [Candidatus Pacearchaeota archaeon]|nr:hypothetical protein [Candidatus Pacearchaeota archaeon]